MSLQDETGLNDGGRASPSIFPLTLFTGATDAVCTARAAAASRPLFLHITPETASSYAERERLYQHFNQRISTNILLNRSLVSNQLNRRLPISSWFKYKESFSEPFVRYILQSVLRSPTPGTLLDPFAGVGSALFAARAEGWRTKGIELLPVGIFAARARLAAERIKRETLRAIVEELLSLNFADYYAPEYALQHIPITRGAFPAAEERQLVGYLACCQRRISGEHARVLLLFAAFCILEDISYTRKDGQFLRWDARSGRSCGRIPFNKGAIPTFREALERKLTQMIRDLEEVSPQRSLFEEVQQPDQPGPDPELLAGSTLEHLPRMADASIDAVITSPPYANRYDYTRTYALELVYLGCSQEQVKALRQAMLSCTVENKTKQDDLLRLYRSLGREAAFQRVQRVFLEQAALQEILAILDSYVSQQKLNNPGIATLVRNYFYEMGFVIYELARIIKPGGSIVMVNDNVRYAGEEVPVDLILSAMAEAFGLKVRHIWTLSRGKGNSSQQMGEHGRAELRKCVYLWEK